MKVIFNADDFGLTYGINKAVRDSSQNGIITSCSLMTNGTAYDDAVKLLKTSLNKISIGIHLNLTDGKSNVSYLADKNGNFNNTFILILKGVTAKNNKLLESIEEEFSQQIKIALKANLKIDHLDSDKHVHMIPEIFEIVCKLAQKNKINSVRLTKEPFYFSKDWTYPFRHGNITKNLLLNYFAKINTSTLEKYNLRSVDRVYGVLYSDNMNKEVVFSTLKNAIFNNLSVIEILLHPGYIKDKNDTNFISPLMKKYSQEESREMEAKTLINKELTAFIKTNNISLAKFSDL